MGDMADYYDDRDEQIPRGRYYPDNILADTFIGRVPIAVQRGGIQYPKPKETHMAEPRMTKAQIEHELRVNTDLLAELRKRRVELQEQKAKAIPGEPRTFSMFSVAVRFKMRGKFYQYLILRNGTQYFTTGTKDGQKMFPSWEALVAWLEGPDVYSHSDLEILSSAGKVVSFTSGAVERTGQTPAPF